MPELPSPRPPAPTSLAPNVTGTWTAVVTADRAYYDQVRAADAADAGSISFPAYVAERRIPLTGTEVRIGRRSSQVRPPAGYRPDRPAHRPGVSRLHAELRQAPDGRWTVIDLDSPNGIQVNGKDVPSGTAIPVHLGDQHPPRRLDPRSPSPAHSAQPQRQYFGPTNSSSRATASRFATEIVFGFENRHSTPSRSRASPHNCRMSEDSLAEQIPWVLVPVLAVLQRAADAVNTSVPVGVHQPASELSWVTLHDDLLPLSQLDLALGASSLPHAEETGRASDLRAALLLRCIPDTG